VLLMMGGLGGVFYFLWRGRELAAFLSSSSFLLGLLAATMAGNYPIWLRSTINPDFSLTVANTVAAPYGLRIGFAWWSIGIVLAAAYFAYLFWSIRGKIGARPEGHGY
jgi:cytochrome d ubiquinol oxidase subunit II